MVGHTATAALIATVVIPPLVLLPSLHEPFHLPKLLASEALALVSIALVLWSHRRGTLPVPKHWFSVPAVRVVLPLFVAALVSLLFTDHPAHTQEGTWSLAVGCAALVAWAVGVPRLSRVFYFLLPVAALLAVVGILQTYGRVPTWGASGGADRLGVTSLAGSVGDFAAYLVLPTVLAQYFIWRGFLRAERTAKERWLGGFAVIALGCVLWAAVVSQTLAALAALAIASLALWAFLLPPRRALLVTAVAVTVLASAVLLAEPTRDRLIAKTGSVAAGRVDRVLSGRLDGWKAGAFMFSQRPATGVGHGAYGASFGGAKLGLHERGIELYDGHRFPIFGNAHNEVIEVGAELGVLGLGALAWALWILLKRVRRRVRLDRSDPSNDGYGALALAGLLALVVLGSAYFPFRIALTAYPAILFLGWVLSRDFLDEDGATQAEGAL